MHIKKWTARVWAIIVALVLFSLVMTALGTAVQSAQWVWRLLT